ncbi:MFS transporter [Sodalis sp. RH21]|uniref:MFS transporter n=1 Tax=unclassified Sodalis (in: enterobacteria) TaxID=2636512 RepID=UPI0039B434C2
MATSLTPKAAQSRLLLLTVVLFVSYLCVAIPIPILSVYVTAQLGLGNVWAGLAVGSAFVSTIATRGHAGNLADGKGAKVAVTRGLAIYAAGALVTLGAGIRYDAATSAYLIMLIGRLLIGLGESLVGVGIVAWGIEIVGPAQSGKVMALVGAAVYGAYAVGAPIGLALFERLGFVMTMAISALLPCLGLLAIWSLPGIAPPPHTDRPSFFSVIGQIRWYGLIVCLQGIGFAALEAFFVLYFLEQHWSYAAFGFTTFGVGFVLMRMLFGHLPDRLGGLAVAIGSLAMEAIGQFLIWGAYDPMLALVGAFLTGLGCSMIFPAMGREVVHLIPSHLRGAALGGFIAFQDLAYGLTGPLAGLIADRAGYGSTFLVGAIAAVAGFLMALYLRQIRSGHPRTQSGQSG